MTTEHVVDKLEEIWNTLSACECVCDTNMCECQNIPLKKQFQSETCRYLVPLL